MFTYNQNGLSDEMDSSVLVTLSIVFDSRHCSKKIFKLIAHVILHLLRSFLWEEIYNSNIYDLPVNS